MPKLKAGDTFIYTKEMFEAKLVSEFDDDRAKYIVGKTVEVDYVHLSAHKEMYGLIPNANCSFLVSTIDPFLPGSEKTKPQKRGWNIEYTSTDGVKVNLSSITIDGVEYTESSLKEHFGKCGAALKKLNEIKKLR